MGDAEIQQVLGGVTVAFTNVFGLNGANSLDEDPPHYVYEDPDALGGVPVVGARCADMGGFITRGELPEQQCRGD